MRGKTALKCFDRSKNKIKFMLMKLKYQLGFDGPLEELMSEAQEKYIKCFVEVYETDEQFLRYLFIVMKNRIRDLRFKEYRYRNTHQATISGSLEDNNFINSGGHVRIWNEMAEDHKELNPLDAAIRQDIIEEVSNRLCRDLHKDIFILLVEGKPAKIIAEELGYSVGHIGQVKMKYIWPVVKSIEAIYF